MMAKLMQTKRNASTRVFLRVPRTTSSDNARPTPTDVRTLLKGVAQLQHAAVIMVPPDNLNPDRQSTLRKRTRDSQPAAKAHPPANSLTHVTQLFVARCSGLGRHRPRTVARTAGGVARADGGARLVVYPRR